MSVDLLKQFSETTDQLQKNNNALCYIIPVILDLQYFLEQVKPGTYVTLAKEMKTSLIKRTERYLNVHCKNFEPLPAAASYLEPTISVDLMRDLTRQPLLIEAKNCIRILACNRMQST